MSLEQKPEAPKEAGKDLRDAPIDPVKDSKEQGKKVVDSAHNSMELAEQEPKEKARQMCYQKVVEGITQLRKTDDPKQSRAQRLDHAFEIIGDSLQGVLKNPDFPGAQYLPQAPDTVRFRTFFFKEDEDDGYGPLVGFTVHPDSSGTGGYHFEVHAHNEL
ncbi:MAG: hypothetical protein U0519_04975 [Candidatus Gracilibacteria bacterium]